MGLARPMEALRVGLEVIFICRGIPAMVGEDAAELIAEDGIDTGIAIGNLPRGDPMFECESRK